MEDSSFSGPLSEMGEHSPWPFNPHPESQLHSEALACPPPTHHDSSPPLPPDHSPTFGIFARKPAPTSHFSHPSLLPSASSFPHLGLTPTVTFLVLYPFV